MSVIALGSYWTPLGGSVWDGHQQQTVMECRCICGTVKNVSVRNLREGNSKSCGCKTKALRLEKHRTLSIWLPHEVIWIEAAITLPVQSRAFAYRDISLMSRKSLQQVSNKARLIRLAQRASVALMQAAE